MRASQDLDRASLDRTRLEKYLSAVKETSDPRALHDRSVLLARSLNIKLDHQCFDKPSEQQVPCLTQNTDQLVMDDPHSQSVVASLTTGPPLDLISAVSATPAAGSSSGRLLGSGVVPTAVRSDDRVSLFRPPTAALVGANPVVGLKDWIDHRPGGLNRVFTGEERSIAGHGVPQEPRVGRFLCRPFFEQVELSLVPDELLSCELDASGEGDSLAGGEPEAQVVGPARRRR